MKKFKSLIERTFDFETRAVVYDGSNYVEFVPHFMLSDGITFYKSRPIKPLFVYTLKISNRWSYLKSYVVHTIDPVHRSYAYEYLKNFIQPYNRKNTPQCLPL